MKPSIHILEREHPRQRKQQGQSPSSGPGPGILKKLEGGQCHYSILREGEKVKRRSQQLQGPEQGKFVKPEAEAVRNPLESAMHLSKSLGHYLFSLNVLGSWCWTVQQRPGLLFVKWEGGGGQERNTTTKNPREDAGRLLSVSPGCYEKQQQKASHPSKLSCFVSSQLLFRPICHSVAFLRITLA